MMNEKRLMQTGSCVLTKQKGVTLFFAMIGLVVLLLAAAALLRSVDTNTLIAGNISYRTSATSSGDSGVNTSVTWLRAQICPGAPAGAAANTCPNGNVDNVQNDNVLNGYYSSINQNFMIPAVLQGGGGVVAGVDASGNTVSYVVERMCTTPNVAASAANCVYTEIEDPACNTSGVPCPERSTSALTFRVTARIVGPKGTQSFIQGFVY